MLIYKADYSIHKFNNQYSNVSFRGVSLGNFDKNNQDTTEFFNYENDNIAQRFEEGLQAIKRNAQEKREQVYGFFKKKKINLIQRDEDSEITGFLKAQRIKIEEQEALVKLLQERVELVKNNNDTSERLAKAEQALLLAQRTLEITKEIAQKKDSRQGFDAIAGYDAEKFILTNNFINLVEAERAGQIVEIPNSILFFGPIGNGKTSFAKAFATSAGCNFEKAKPKSSARTKEDREKSFYKDLIKKAENSQEAFMETGIRTIILVDEIDRYAYEGSSILPKLKRFLESCSEDYHCSIFATTNNPLTLPSPIRAEKRMPIKVCIDPPDEVNAALVFEHYLKDYSNVNMKKIDLEELAEEICSVHPDMAYNNSQIEYICSECVKNQDMVTQDDLLYQIRTNQPAIDKDNLSKYQQEKEKLLGENYD